MLAATLSTPSRHSGDPADLILKLEAWDYEAGMCVGGNSGWPCQAQGWLCLLGLGKENAFLQVILSPLLQGKMLPAPETMPGISRLGALPGEK